MKIGKIALHIVVVVSIAAFIITGNSVAALVSFGEACINLGILLGERSRNAENRKYRR